MALLVCYFCWNIHDSISIKKKLLNLADNIYFIHHHIINYNMSMSLQLQRLSLKAKLFRGLADSTRLSIIELLRDGENLLRKLLKVQVKVSLMCLIIYRV